MTGDSGQPFGVDESNWPIRREFIRPEEAERSLLTELTPWAQSVAAGIAKEFYDWQFEFGPTRRFFESYAQGAGMPLGQLRQALERAQTGYFTQIFEGAAENWGVGYFGRRLNMDAIHDKIDLPFKWSTGSYAEFQRLTAIYLRKSLKDPKKLAAAEQAIFKAFNYDIQAIGDSAQAAKIAVSVAPSIAIPAEAAHAGQAGNGLAAVANEVKAAARHTDSAKEIGSIINQINGIAHRIASAVEAQTEAANEIVTAAVQGAGLTAKNSGFVAVAARTTTQRANDMQKASRELSRMAVRLRSVVSKFAF